MAMITVQVEVDGETPAYVAKLIELAAGYMDLVGRFPPEGEPWHIGGKVHVMRENFGMVETLR